MERMVIFQDGMENDPADQNDVQAYARQSLDHIVADAITADRRFAGFVTSIEGAADIEVAPGRIYAGGEVFDRAAPTLKSFLQLLPAASRRIALVIATVQEIDTDVQQREFLVDEATGASEARAVSMQRARIANIGFRLGQESPDPIDPLVGADEIAIARVLLKPEGVTDVTMLFENMLDSVAGLADRVVDLETFQALAKPQIVALGSDIAALKQGQVGLVTNEKYGRLLVRMASVEEQAGIPGDALDSDADFFLDLEESDPAFAGYDAKVEEGIRFAPAASMTSVLTIANALDAAAKIADGVLLPRFTTELRLTSGPRQGEVPASSYSYQANELVQQTVSRERIRYGDEFTVCTNSQWWGTGQYDYASRTFAKDGETFEDLGVAAEFADGHAVIQRLRRFWTDTYEEPYWANLVVDHIVPGALVAETFLNANAMILAEVGITFTRLAAAGGVTVAICEVDRGQPVLERAISVTAVDRDDLVVNSETRISIKPVLLEGGKRYAIVVITAADHYLATTGGANFPAGTFFYVLDGAYQQGDGSRDLCFSLYAAKFAQARAVIELQPVQLEGGIAAIDILAGTVVPGSTDLTFEVRIGSTWYPLGPSITSALNAGGALQGLLPLRAVFTGTVDVMPMLTLTGSRVIVSRPKTALVHVSKPRTLPGSGSQQIRVIARLEYFEAAHHTAGVKLRTGAGHATVVAPSSYVDEPTSDGAIERTWIFNLGAPVTSYRIQSEATTDSALRTFHFAFRKDFAL